MPHRIDHNPADYNHTTEQKAQYFTRLPEYVKANEARERVGEKPMNFVLIWGPKCGLEESFFPTREEADKDLILMKLRELRRPYYFDSIPTKIPAKGLYGTWEEVMQKDRQLRKSGVLK